MVAIAQRARRSPADALGPWALDVVHNVDCARGLRALPDDCLDVIVTSPPYWGQRGAGGLGSEADPRDYVARLTALLAEAMRCLKPSGTLWLNVGDAYNTPINWREADHVYSSLGADGAGLPATNSAYTKNRGRRRAFVRGEVGWLRYGNLLAIPYRIVTAMCDRGFLFRGEVIWEKSRPMPEGLCRRPHRRHEGIYVFARDERHAFQTRPPVGSCGSCARRRTSRRTARRFRSICRCSASGPPAPRRARSCAIRSWAAARPGARPSRSAIASWDSSSIRTSAGSPMTTRANGLRLAARVRGDQPRLGAVALTLLRSLIAFHQASSPLCGASRSFSGVSFR
jgi:DNA methylase